VGYSVSKLMQKDQAEGALQQAPSPKIFSMGSSIITTSMISTLEYLNKVHQRTTRVAQCISPDLGSLLESFSRLIQSKN
jgi:hypothetical protein